MTLWQCGLYIWMNTKTKMFIHLTYFTWAVHLLCIYFWCCKLFTWSFDFSTSQNINCFVAKINSSHWRKQQSCNTPWLWDERREALRGVVGQHITFRFDPVGVSLQLCHGGDWPRASASLLGVKRAAHWGEEGLTESGDCKTLWRCAN